MNYSMDIPTSEVVKQIVQKINDDASQEPKILPTKVQNITLVFLQEEINKDADMKAVFEVKAKPWFNDHKKLTSNLINEYPKITFILERYPQLLKQFICDWYEFGSMTNVTPIYNAITKLEVKPKNEKITYKCSMCTGEFQSQYNLEAHEKSHLVKQAREEEKAAKKAATITRCDLCGIDCGNVSNYNLHYTKCSIKAAKKAPELLKCVTCDRLFPDAYKCGLHSKACAIKLAKKIKLPVTEQPVIEEPVSISQVNLADIFTAPMRRRRAATTN